jgi:prolyl-tRNA editing enzyme YbaK/EbsC (Cys-tRNA(Pro) deacylase)
VSETRVAALVGEALDRADADFVRAETGFAIGGVAPIGHLRPVVTLIDEHLLTFEEIWAAAGHPNLVFRLRPADLVTMTGGRVAIVS